VEQPDWDLEIEREIERFRKRRECTYPSLRKELKERSFLLTHFLDNFPLQFLDVDGSPRYDIAKLGLMDKTIESQLKADEKKPYSRFYRMKTYREYFADLDRALAESGGDLKEVRRLFDEDRTSPTIRGRVSEIIFPAYVRLRRMGYSHNDLA
jgi:hypothetical protein